jgi:hypothetical protein
MAPEGNAEELPTGLGNDHDSVIVVCSWKAYAALAVLFESSMRRSNMIKASLSAIAGIGLLVSYGSAFACEMHGKDHTSLQTAATQPMAVSPPVVTPAPKPEPVVLPSAPATPAVKAMSSEAFGGIGCPRMRNKQTVYYTD